MSGQGVIGETNMDLSYQNSNREDATSGDVRNGPIFNISSVGSIGTVKLLALAGLGWVVYKVLMRK